MNTQTRRLPDPGMTKQSGWGGMSNADTRDRCCRQRHGPDRRAGTGHQAETSRAGAVRRLAAAVLLAAMALGLPPTVDSATAQGQNRAGNAPAGTAPAGTAPMVLLQHSPVVDDRFIRLGDLFANIPADKTDIAVAHAPTAGKRTEFPIHVLLELSKKFQLGYRPLTIQDSVMVLRASLEIGSADLEDAIAAAVLDRDPIADSVIVTLDNPNAAIHLPTDRPASVSVDRLEMQRSGRFVATLSAPVSNRDVERLTVSGQTEAMVNVPIAANRISKNDPIGQADILFEQRSRKRLNARVITEVAEILGKSPKRGIGAGDVFRAGDLKTVPLVLKGALVALEFRGARMQLTTQGRAQEEGGMGETIRVVNTHSNRGVLGVVVGPNRVAVTAPGLPVQPFTAQR